MHFRYSKYHKYHKTRTLGAVVLALSLIAPHANAATIVPLPFAAASTPTGQGFDIAGADLVLANHRKKHRMNGNHNRRTDRGRDHRRTDRDRDRRRSDYDRDHRRVDRDRSHHRRGYRGYPERRYGYRQDDDGWWYPLAAFALGAVILNQQTHAAPSRQTYSNSYSNWDHIPGANMAAHDNWCDLQYRSYDRGSKTFQPYNGPRRYCNSPYDRL